MLKRYVYNCNDEEKLHGSSPYWDEKTIRLIELKEWHLGPHDFEHPWYPVSELGSDSLKFAEFKSIDDAYRALMYERNESIFCRLHDV